MKHKYSSIVILLLFLLFILSFLSFLSLSLHNVSAQGSFQDFPQPYDTKVNDFALLFSPEQTEELKNTLAQVQEQTTAEVVVVTINSTSPFSPQEYRTALFNEWSIGKKSKDNGLLILYAVQEKRIEVEAGYGLEGILPDSKVGRILDETYVPLRDQGNVTEGIVAAAEALSQVVVDNTDEVISGRKQNEWVKQIIFAIVLSILIILIMYAITEAISRKKGVRKSRGSGVGWVGAPIFFPRSGGFGGGGFGGGMGGGGFGGGGSGGGGAGR